MTKTDHMKVRLRELASNSGPVATDVEIKRISRMLLCKIEDDAAEEKANDLVVDFLYDQIAYWRNTFNNFQKESSEDKIRMDWLVSKTVNVREPLVYGSRDLFWSQAVSEEWEEYHKTTLREQIDAAMKKEKEGANDK